MKKFWPLILIGLGACQSTASAPPRVASAAPPAATASSGERVWLRTDGQRASSSPVLLGAFNSDKAACVGDADYVSTAAEDCMQKRGYVFVPQDQAPKIAADLAARRAAR
jgi:hypothetical protein